VKTLNEDGADTGPNTFVVIAMYHKATDEIERKGGKVVGVQLDYELKEKEENDYWFSGTGDCVRKRIHFP
jgi:hypothetical protein